MLSQVVHVANRKRRWYYSLDKWQIISTLIATIFECPKHQDDNHDGDQQSHHNDQPLYQRIALVKKKSSNDVTFYAQLMSEHAEDLRYKPCATVDLSCPCRPMPLNDHNNCDRHNSCIVSTHTQNPLHLNRLAIMRRPAFILMLRTTNLVHAL